MSRLRKADFLFQLLDDGQQKHSGALATLYTAACLWLDTFVNFSSIILFPEKYVSNEVQV